MCPSKWPYTPRTAVSLSQKVVVFVPSPSAAGTCGSVAVAGPVARLAVGPAVAGEDDAYGDDDAGRVVLCLLELITNTVPFGHCGVMSTARVCASLGGVTRGAACRLLSPAARECVATWPCQLGLVSGVKLVPAGCLDTQCSTNHTTPTLPQTGLDAQNSHPDSAGCGRVTQTTPQRRHARPTMPPKRSESFLADYFWGLALSEAWRA